VPFLSILKTHNRSPFSLMGLLYHILGINESGEGGSIRFALRLARYCLTPFAPLALLLSLMWGCAPHLKKEEIPKFLKRASKSRDLFFF
ncbi:MAG: hypothetical protein PHI94_05905, partial [Eubacteriaceae bacterium]|nr:hypothetical protein [Eubacteriaceae bacterium]